LPALASFVYLPYIVILTMFLIINNY